jgi:hypothetical protein
MPSLGLGVVTQTFPLYGLLLSLLSSSASTTQLATMMKLGIDQRKASETKRHLFGSLFCDMAARVLQGCNLERLP